MSKAKTAEEKAKAKADKLAAKEKLNAGKGAESSGSSSQNGLKDDSAIDTGSDAPTGSNSEQNGLGEESNIGSSQNGLGEESLTKRVAIVIPYLKERAQGTELLFAIRSIAKNFAANDYQLVVIGDKEDWFSDEIHFIDKACIGSNPQADVVDKMKAIILDESINEEFIWTNDDIYFVAPTTVEDIKVLKTSGMLVDEPGNNGLYNRNRAKTILALQAINRPIRNFDTHMPFFFEKERMIEVFEAFPGKLEEGMLIASAYYNLHNDESVPASKAHWMADNWMLRVVSDLKSEDKKALFRSLIKQKHFLNHSEAGFSNLLNDWLSRQFPEKCRFEK